MTSERRAGEARETAGRALPTHLRPEHLPDALRDNVLEIMRKYRRVSDALDLPVAFDVQANGEMHFDIHETVAERYIDWLLDTIGPSGLWHVDTDALKRRYRGEGADGHRFHPVEIMIEVGEVFVGGRVHPANARVFLTLTSLMGRLVPPFGVFWRSWGQNGVDITAPEAAPLLLGAKGNLVVLGKPRSRPD